MRHADIDASPESFAPRIVPLSAATLPDFLGFFDGVAFSDNPDWSSCYCQCFYEDHSKIDWSARTATENRSLAARRCASGDMRGYLAYVGGEVVGWCNAAPRQLLHALDAEPVAEPEATACILCFLVSPTARGRGLASSLLEGACRELRAQGMLFVEANPRPDAKNVAELHYGPLPMYLANGFVIVRTDNDGSVWVRRQLQTGE